MYSESSELIIRLDFLNKFEIFFIFRLKLVFETTAMLKLQIYSIFYWLLLPGL